MSLEHAYYYFMCMAHMYNGKLDEADKYAGKCLEIAEKQQSDYDIFIAKLLGVMVKMSGWHNIFFCANDISVDEEVLRMAEEYHFGTICRTFMSMRMTTSQRSLPMRTRLIAGLYILIKASRS